MIRNERSKPANEMKLIPGISDFATKPGKSHESCHGFVERYSILEKNKQVSKVLD